MTAAKAASSDWYRSRRGNIIHAASCPRRGAAVPWLYVDVHASAASVDEIINAYPWLRWCSSCRPRHREKRKDAVDDFCDAVTDTAALDAIAEMLSGKEWQVDTIEHVADVVRLTGRSIDDDT